MPPRISDEQKHATLSDDKAFAEWYVTEFMPEHVPERAHTISEEGKREMVHPCGTRDGRSQAISAFGGPWRSWRAEG